MFAVATRTWDTKPRLASRAKRSSRVHQCAILDPFEMTSPGIAGVKPEKQEHVWKDQDEDER
jgi:hypothetical protein